LYRRYIVGGALLVLLQTVFIVALLVQRTRRRAAETEKEELMGQLQGLAGRLIAARESERARIARDLHDDVSQQLAGLAIGLSGLRRRVGARPEEEQLAGDVSSLQERTVVIAEHIRHLSHDLHPSVLQHAGLVAALSAHCTELRSQQTIALAFNAEGDFETMDPQAALCLYRVAQEALRNVFTHAEARHADVRLLRLGNRAQITIADDGKGFDPVRARDPGRGLGLVSINERVRSAGGTVSIATERQKGTRVSVQVPIARQDTAAAGDESARSA
jgi:two-component system sensor histidine kinase UhpB